MSKINQSVLEPRLIGVDTLTLDPRNARVHNERNIEAIKQSLSTFGQQKPIVVRDGVVIAGNGTLEAARRLGWLKIAAVEFDSNDEAAAKAYALADNRTAELAEWDIERLAELREEINPFSLEQVGWTDEEFQELFGNQGHARLSGELLGHIPRVVTQPETRVEYGQVFKLSQHILVCSSVIKHTGKWRIHLDDDCVFLPYPGPYVTLTTRAKHDKLVMVQPSPFYAGHLVDAHRIAFGEDSVRVL